MSKKISRFSVVMTLFFVATIPVLFIISAKESAYTTDNCTMVASFSGGKGWVNQDYAQVVGRTGRWYRCNVDGRVTIERR